MNFTDEQRQRYARHFVLSELGEEGQANLLNGKVLVIGAGAIGGVALMYLAAAGVGTIGIADYDDVDLSNLQRQIIHRMDKIGTPKLLSAQDTIRSINPDTNIILHNSKVTVDNIMELLSDYDFVLDCTDRIETKFLINDACVLAEKPYCHAGVVRFGGQVMTYVPSQGPCLRCLLEDVPSPEDSPLCAQVGVLGSVTGIIGSIQATEAIKYLTASGELLTGRILNVDTLSMEFRTTKIPHSAPDCKICGSVPTIVNLSDNRSEYERQ